MTAPDRLAQGQIPSTVTTIDLRVDESLRGLHVNDVCAVLVDERAVLLPVPRDVALAAGFSVIDVGSDVLLASGLLGGSPTDGQAAGDDRAARPTLDTTPLFESLPDRDAAGRATDVDVAVSETPVGPVDRIAPLEKTVDTNASPAVLADSVPVAGPEFVFWDDSIATPSLVSAPGFQPAPIDIVPTRNQAFDVATSIEPTAVIDQVQVLDQRSDAFEPARPYAVSSARPGAVIDEPTWPQVERRLHDRDTPSAESSSSRGDSETSSSRALDERTPQAETPLGAVRSDYVVTSMTLTDISTEHDQQEVAVDSSTLDSPMAAQAGTPPESVSREPGAIQADSLNEFTARSTRPVEAVVGFDVPPLFDEVAMVANVEEADARTSSADATVSDIVARGTSMSVFATEPEDETSATTLSSVYVVRSSRLVRRLDAGFTLRVPELDLKPGELLVVRGTERAGKTTLARTLSAFDPIDEGTLIVAGVLDSDISAEERATREGASLAYASAFPWFVPDLTVIENVELAMLVQEETPEHARASAQAELAALDCSEVAQRRVDSLSRSESVRVGLARALVGEPALVVADDITVGLDNESVADLVFRLLQVAGDGAAVVVTTTDPRVWQSLVIERGARAGVLDQGVLSIE